MCILYKILCFVLYFYVFLYRDVLYTNYYIILYILPLISYYTGYIMDCITFHYNILHTLTDILNSI